MEGSNGMAPSQSLFQVYLRLRPPIHANTQPTSPWLIVERPNDSAAHPTHITLQPPNDSRKRAIERFGFTKIFGEDAEQLKVFEEIGTLESINNTLHGRDGLIATLGVTGSGKSHTILGSKAQRGLTQMTLDVVFRSIGENICKTNHLDAVSQSLLISALQSSDASEAQILSASVFFDSTYSDGDRARLSRAQTPMSRAQTPLMVRMSTLELPGSFPTSPPTGPTQSLHSRANVLRDTRACGDADASKQLPQIPETGIQKDPWRPPSKVSFWHRLSPKKSPAKQKSVQDTITNHHIRKPPLPRPSALPQIPDTSGFSVSVDRDSQYVVFISMYEVYNDRIFDLLSSANSAAMMTRQGAALQKGLTRRPLLFKNTELSSDRKVVAGLRKIACSTYDEAIMVLEAGLTERRVAGTGSNSVSSRSHGFFCIEVKRSRLSPYGRSGPLVSGQWTGSTLSIVDLAGSERARNAKTTGSTLAEAGKINESLMYLGQCLQVQSDCQQDGSKPIIPFRQCKLTELLFSNSFPTSGHATRAPQRAVMVVTADPSGDFNATSQILRYSALAREVTVPRIPSVTSTIIGNNNIKPRSGCNTPHDLPPNYFSAQELEQAHNEVNRLSEECDALAVRLAKEEIKRTEAELKLQAAEDKTLAMEQDIREECWAEMEERMVVEKERWRGAWLEQRLAGEEYMDGKVEIMQKTASFTIHEDHSNRTVEELERENETLRSKLRAMEQEMQHRSPTKKSKKPEIKSPIATKGLGLVLQEASSNANIATNPFLASLRASTRDSDSTLKASRMDRESTVFEDASPRKLSLRSSIMVRSSMEADVEQTPATTKKKTRKLTTRKWDLGDPHEIGL